MTGDSRHESAWRGAGRLGLAAVLLVAGVGHLINAQAFLAQVPPWFPAPSAVVFVSGLVEIALAMCLVVVARYRAAVEWVVAGFFVVVFPGNISQFLTHTSAFGLDTDLARAIRLLFQPLLVIWALWSTGAWRSWRERARPVQKATAN